MRALLALNLEKRKRQIAKANLRKSKGRGKKGSMNSSKVNTRKELAQMANISEQTYSRVKKISEKGSKEQKQRLEKGESTINEIFEEIRSEEVWMLHGDSFDKLDELEEDSVDLILTDPPYNLGLDKWDKELPSVGIWKKCLRVLKPGGFAYVMTGARQENLAEAIKILDEAGFRIKFTSLYWTYLPGGMPKGLNLSKAIDKKFGTKGELIQKKVINKINLFDKEKRDKQEYEIRKPTHAQKLTQNSILIDKNTLVKYTRPDLSKSSWQIANSFIPYLLLVIAMYFSLSITYWLTFVLAIPAAGFMVRIFIIFHDCGHGSFFKSRRANNILGFIAGLITFAPYYHWNRKHAIHHASAGDLDRRGIGDIRTLTVKEYQELPKRERLTYKIVRNPMVMLLIGPVYLFLIYNRFVIRKTSSRERYYVYATNLGILVLVIISSILIGLKAYLMIQLPIILIAGIAGIWLFYVQHQFEGVYWSRHQDWNFQNAALEGSSFYKLPKVLQWFSGNIGFHHIHHLSPRIPNYNLELCHKEIPEFQNVKPLTLLDSFKSIKYRLWDEENNELVGFEYFKS